MNEPTNERTIWKRNKQAKQKYKKKQKYEDTLSQR